MDSQGAVLIKFKGVTMPSWKISVLLIKCYVMVCMSEEAAGKYPRVHSCICLVARRLVLIGAVIDIASVI
jgi:hypothetical protein